MISVIIATFNSERTLTRCLSSLWGQVDADFEVLVADGGSSDGTGVILKAAQDRIAWQTSGPDQGVYDAWNKAMTKARGEWIMFLGSDDWLEEPTTLARLGAAAMQLTPDERQFAYLFGRTALMEQGDMIEELGRQPLPNQRLEPDTDVPFSHTGLLHHHTLFDNFGPYDATFRSAGDYEFLLRSALDPRVRFYQVDLRVARMASGGMSTGPASRLTHYREIERARAKHGVAAKPAWLRAAIVRATCLAFLNRCGGAGVALTAANFYRSIRGKKKRRAI